MFSIKGNIGSIFLKNANLADGIGYHLEQNEKNCSCSLVVSAAGHDIPVHMFRYFDDAPSHLSLVKMELDHIFGECDGSKSIDINELESMLK